MKDFIRKNGLWILFVAAVVTGAMALGSFLSPGEVDPAAGLLRTLTAPVRRAAASVTGWAENIYGYAFRYESLQEENSALKARVAELEEQAQQGEADSRENERLRNLLGLREQRRDFVLESAPVTEYSGTNWASTLTLGKGSSVGIQVDDCVVDEYGALVGVVAQVGANWSTVITLVDAEMEMGARVARTDEAAILEGDFALMLEGLVKMDYLSPDVALSAGDLIVTSGLGGVYPSGLVVGTVTQVRADPSGITSYAVVEPRADLNDLQQVFIIKDFSIIE